LTPQPIDVYTLFVQTNRNFHVDRAETLTARAETPYRQRKHGEVGALQVRGFIREHVSASFSCCAEKDPFAALRRFQLGSRMFVPAALTGEPSMLARARVAQGGDPLLPNAG
jgi:hypothetical protein